MADLFSIYYAPNVLSQMSAGLLMGIDVSLNESDVRSILELDNSMIAEGELRFKMHLKTNKIAVELKRKGYYSYPFLVGLNSRGEGKLKIIELMKQLAPGEKADLVVSAKVGRRTIKREIKIKRNTLGIAKDPSKGKRSLAPLYDRIAKDLIAGKPLVITSNLVLWDQSFGRGYGSKWADGKKPETNLYWGWGPHGVYYYFNRRKDWTLVYRKEGERVVFRKQFYPNSFWIKRGVKNPFAAYAVFNVYTYDRIKEGYRDFARNLFTDRRQIIVLKDGKSLEAGGQSQVVGYVGHMISEGARIIQDVKKSKRPAAEQPKGVYMTACLSANMYSHSVLDNQSYGVLFTTELMFPGAYIHAALFESIASGENGDQRNKSVASAVKKERGIYPRMTFVSSDQKRIEKYSLPFEGDADQDGIDNRIDPEPGRKNKYRAKDKSVVVTTSNQKDLIINFEQTCYINKYFVDLPFIIK